MEEQGNSLGLLWLVGGSGGRQADLLQTGPEELHSSSGEGGPVASKSERKSKEAAGTGGSKWERGRGKKLQMPVENKRAKDGEQRSSA